MKPRDAQARFLKGFIFTEQGKTKDAIEILTKLTQDYRSNSLSNVIRKRQYWVKEGTQWKIIYEGAG